MKLDFTITSEYEGKRLDSVLAELVEDYSRSQIQKLFSSGDIFVNGEECRVKKYTVSEGDEVSIVLTETDAEEAQPIPENIPLNIVFEDANYLVIDKPVGLVVHPANGNKNGTLVNGLIYYLGEDFLTEMKDITSSKRPGIVHRIDKDTTGLLVVAKTKVAFKDLSQKFKEHDITRKYTALVYNNFSEDEGKINESIGRDPRNRLRRAVNGLEPREAITNYRVIERMGKYNLIEASLETGRTHQIRVHMAFVGHPVVGDPVYGPRKDILGAGGQMLHAGVLGFTTIEGSYLEFTKELPKHFQAVLSKARKTG